jgi:hypothetical protein
LGVISLILFKSIYRFTFHIDILGGVMVSMLAIGPKVHGFSPGLAIDFKGSKNHSMPPFRGRVKPSAPCRKIYWHVKDPFEV